MNDTQSVRVLYTDSVGPLQVFVSRFDGPRTSYFTRDRAEGIAGRIAQNGGYARLVENGRVLSEHGNRDHLHFSDNLR